MITELLYALYDDIGGWASAYIEMPLHIMELLALIFTDITNSHYFSLCRMSTYIFMGEKIMYKSVCTLQYILD